MSRKEESVIIKRYEDDAHGDHHGGGWKVAYADFMTAMMAFFLLLWILAASDEEKLRGLADYFTPSLSQAGGRGQGVLEGMVMGEDGVMSGSDGPQSEVQLPSFGEENPLAVFDSRLRNPPPEVIVEYEMLPEGVPPQDALDQPGDVLEITEVDAPDAGEMRADAATAPGAAEAGEAREETFARIEDQIRQALDRLPDMSELAGNIDFARTPDGLMVRILDKETRSLFARGSAAVDAKTRDLIDIIGKAIAGMPNGVTITGHTDATAFANADGYSNWELSADRANATRRILMAAGVAPTRFTRISGVAATQPIDPAHPTAPENRRITVLVQYPQPSGD